MSNAWRFWRFWRDESGQSLVEYVLIIALVAIALIGTIAIMRNRMNDRINEIDDCLNAAANCPAAEATDVGEGGEH